MKQSDPLQLVDAGSLERPGPIGRSVRLLLGIACLHALYQLILYRQDIVATPVTVLPNIVLMALVALFIVNYVVNIGFGRSWGRWPSYLFLGGGLLLAATGWLTFDTPDHPVLGVWLWLWLVYFYSHLGTSFVLSAVIATPGCEMRALPELFGRIARRSVEEHHCPAAFITKIDEWEHRREIEG